MTAQVAINSDASNSHPSAMPEIKSLDKGVLIPRVANTGEIAIPAGGLAEGLMVYQTDSPKGFYFYNGTEWKSISDNLGDHTATQPLRLANMTTAERDLVTALPGMQIYNTDVFRRQYYLEDAIVESVKMDAPNHTETDCTSIAQSFGGNSTTSITEVYLGVNFNGNTNDITVKVIDGDGTGGTVVGSETFTFASVTGNNFVFTTPVDLLCCGTYTIEITQVGNTNLSASTTEYIDAEINVGNLISNGKFYKDGLQLDVDPYFDSGCSCVLGTFYDLEITVTTQRKLWVDG